MFNNSIDIPMYIGDKEVFTNDKRIITPPHDHKNVVGTFNYGGKKEVNDLIEISLKVRNKCINMSWENDVNKLVSWDLLAVLQPNECLL